MISLLDAQYQCFSCHKLLQDRQTLEQHCKSNNHHGTWDCEKCSPITVHSTEEDLSRHSSIFHTDSSYATSQHDCTDSAVLTSLDFKKYTSHYNEREIMIAKTKDQSVDKSKDFCDNKFAENGGSVDKDVSADMRQTKDGELNLHSQTTIKNLGEANQAAPCKDQIREANFDDHQHNGTNSNLSHMFKCYLCDAKFDRLLKLTEHQASSAHTFVCPICGTKFVAVELLKDHMKNHTAQPLKCEKCLAMLQNEAELKLHHSAIHSFVYQQCLKSFDNLENILNHVKFQHSPKPSIDDLFCSVLSGPPPLARKDIRWSEPLFACHLCGIALFRTAALLTLHHAHVHRFECEVCHAVFEKEDAFLKHKFSAHLFACQECRGTFESIEVLGVHRLAHHNAAHTAGYEFFKHCRLEHDKFKYSNKYHGGTISYEGVHGDDVGGFLRNKDLEESLI